MKLVLASIAANIAHHIPALLAKAPEDCTMVCIPTAGNVEEGSEQWLEQDLEAFRKLGFKITLLDIDSLSAEAVSAKIENADVILVAGGNTFFLLQKMNECGFEPIIRRALERGTLYIGSSAGSIVCCPDTGYVNGLDDPRKANLKDMKGLGLIDFFVMVHIDNPHFSEKAQAIMAKFKKDDLQMIGLNDDQALLIDGNTRSIL